MLNKIGYINGIKFDELQTHLFSIEDRSKYYYYPRRKSVDTRRASMMTVFSLFQRRISITTVGHLAGCVISVTLMSC